MKTVTLFFVAFSATTFAQTPIIAHKSHSGNDATFFIDPSSNFGAIMEPEMRLHREELRRQQANIFVDTLQVNDSVQIINYRNRDQEIIHRKEEIIPVKPAFDKAKPVQQPVVKPQQKGKRKSAKSYLLFVFTFTFGGLFATRMFVKN